MYVRRLDIEYVAKEFVITLYNNYLNKLVIYKENYMDH